MAEGETRSAFLSKVAKFVRNPTKDWSELDQKDQEADSGYSKEALKEMIERKRQNDFVRKREFDHLRKLRRREPMAGGDQAGRPSFFQSSLTSNHDDRAETLKKIDEIEAQMSRQWWKGKQGEEGGAHAGAFPVAHDSAGRPEAAPTQPPDAAPDSEVPLNSSRQLDDNFEPTEASELRPSTSQWGGVPASPPQAYAATQLAEAAPTVPASMQMMQRAAPPMQPPARPISRPQPLASHSGHVPIGAGFSTQRLFAAPAADSLTDPDLEEAAIRFANGDDAGAEQSLFSALESDNPRPELAEAWMSALFDLYRATGQQNRFDSVAIEFANRFGRSAPAWFSTPDQLGRERTVRKQVVASEPDWESPAQLSAAALSGLQELMRVPGPLLLDWQNVAAIAPDAVHLLARMVAQWSHSPVNLVFRGYASLERALQAITPSGDRSVDPVCWQLRMDALRIMGMQDAFELVALDYCVTYEVSPPSWQDPQCACQLEGNTDPAAEEAEALRSSWEEPRSRWDEPQALTAPMGLEDRPPAMVELTGEILGDASDAVAKLEAAREGSSRMVVSCARVIRVDFPAAGSILNWVATQQAQGYQIQFREVNRLVAAFFTVIGINEHARVVPRSA